MASLAPLRSSTAWSLAHVDSLAAADWPLPDAPPEREARGIVAVGDPPSTRAAPLSSARQMIRYSRIITNTGLLTRATSQIA